MPLKDPGQLFRTPSAFRRCPTTKNIENPNSVLQTELISRDKKSQYVISMLTLTKVSNQYNKTA